MAWGICGARTAGDRMGPMRPMGLMSLKADCLDKAATTPPS